MPFVRWATATRLWCGLSKVSGSVGPVLRQMPWLRSGRIWQRLAECRSRRLRPRLKSQKAGSVGATAVAIPTRREDIDTWSDVQGRVYSVQVGAFRGVPDRRALSTLGTLTREDAGADGWLRLFSGRFETEEEARAHLAALKQDGRTDAFVVVYINGRRIPLLQASTTATGGLDVVNRPVAPSRDEEPVESGGGVAPVDNAGAAQDSSVPQWRVQLGSTPAPFLFVWPTPFSTHLWNGRFGPAGMVE